MQNSGERRIDQAAVGRAHRIWRKRGNIPQARRSDGKGRMTFYELIRGFQPQGQGRIGELVHDIAKDFHGICRYRRKRPLAAWPDFT